MSEADQKTDAEHKRNEDELKNYKMENPEFRKKMDKVCVCVCVFSVNVCLKAFF